MNPGPAPARAPQHLSDVAVTRAGHTRITARALTKAVEAIIAEAFAIVPGNVKVGLHDSGGRLGIDATVAVIAPAHQRAASSGPGQEESVYSRAAGARAEIIRRVGLMTGSEVDRVDIRVAGLRPTRKARVR